MNKILITIIAILFIAIGWVGVRSLNTGASGDAATAPVATTTDSGSTPASTAMDAPLEAPTTPAPTTALVSPEGTPTFTAAQVAEHNSAHDCYTIVRGTVYDLTPFVSKHPGGVSAIANICGVDGTSMFTAQHGSQRKPERELAGLEIGVLAQ